MVRQRHGRIITIASVQAMATDGGAGSYVAAKGALVSFTKSLAVELAPHRVLANAIAPARRRFPGVRRFLVRDRPHAGGGRRTHLNLLNPTERSGLAH